MLTESAAEMGLYSGKWNNYLKSLNLIMYSVRGIYIQQRQKIQDLCLKSDALRVRLDTYNKGKASYILSI